MGVVKVFYEIGVDKLHVQTLQQCSHITNPQSRTFKTSSINSIDQRALSKLNSKLSILLEISNENAKVGKIEA